MAELDPKTGKPVVTSAGKFMGWNTIFGRDGDKGEPYMTRIWFWRLRMHIFHRGDADPDPHDHPFNFVTFPLTSYVEEVYEADPVPGTVDEPDPETIRRRVQVVPAFRFSYRPATHCHRVLGALGKAPRDLRFLFDETKTPPIDWNRKIVTLLWFSKPVRKWGFLKNRDDKWCWIGWREYILGGGKDTPCQ